MLTSSLDWLLQIFYSASPLSWVLVFIVVYAVYYMRRIVKVPELYTGNRLLSDFLYQHISDLNKPFAPTFWAYGEVMQCLLGATFRRAPSIQYEKQRIDTPDGGELVLSWLNKTAPDQHPTIILLPGLTGSCKEGYMLNLVNQIKQLGFRAVVFNNRGNGGAAVKTARTYNACNTEDLELVVNTVQTQCPGAPLMGVGVSLGGLILTHYISSLGARCPLRAGYVISTAWNVFLSAESLEQPLYRFLLNRHLARGLVDKFDEHHHLFSSDRVDHKQIRRSRTIREFDHHFTAKVFGFDGHEEYYRAACIHDKLSSVKTPLLVLQAADDPFCPHSSLPISEFSNHDTAALILTKHGGHVGFLNSTLGESLIDRVFKSYCSAVFTQPMYFIPQTSNSDGSTNNTEK